jgi:hypothetical protein
MTTDAWRRLRRDGGGTGQSRLTPSFVVLRIARSL